MEGALNWERQLLLRLEEKSLCAKKGFAGDISTAIGVLDQCIQRLMLAPNFQRRSANDRCNCDHDEQWQYLAWKIWDQSYYLNGDGAAEIEGEGQECVSRCADDLVLDKLGVEFLKCFKLELLEWMSQTT